MNIELKPCPFCGGDARIFKESWGLGGFSRNAVYAQCINCKARTRSTEESTDYCVRWDESRNRKDNQGIVTVIGKPKDTAKTMKENNINFLLTKRGGVVLNFDNELLKNNSDIMRHCYRTRKTMLNPIVDWTDSDVWTFLKHYGCEANPLYQCGNSRIGCIGCPLSGAKQQKKDFVKYPKYKQNYIRAFQRMVEYRESIGLTNDGAWKDGESVFRWWLGEDTNQLTLFAETELEEIMQDMNF